MSTEKGLDYAYVNVGYEKEEFFKRETVTLDKVPAMKEEHDKNFYVTVWRYPGGEYKKHAEEGNFIGPFYADIDSKDLNHARKSAINLVNFLLDDLKVPKSYIKVSFSGNKGFHVKVPYEAIGAKNSKKLPKAYERMAESLKKICPDLDLNVYDDKRLFRAMNTVNGKSGLYKIPITVQELYTLDMEEVKRMAKETREEVHRKRLLTTNLRQVEKLKKFYLKSLEEYKQEQKEAGKDRRKKDQKQGKVKEPIITETTPCIRSLLEGVKEGERNEASLRLASFLNNKKVSKKKAREELLKWNKRNDPPLPEKEVMKTIDSAYRHGYNFSCKDNLLKKYCDKEKCSLISEKSKSK